MNRSVMLYGAVPPSEREKMLSLLPFVPAVVTVASEFYGATWGLKIDWSNKLNAARRRNTFAAAECNAIVIIGRPKFATAIVRSFRHRGRRIFWYSKGQMQEVEVSEKIARTFTREPAMTEPEIWDEQRREKQEKMDAIFTGEVGSVVRDKKVKHIHRDGVTGRDANGVPTFGWTEPVNDVDCADTDVLHPSVQREFKVDEFAKRQAEVSKSFRELKEDPPPMWKMGLMTVCPQPDDLSTPTSDEQFEKWMIIIGQALHPAY